LEIYCGYLPWQITEGELRELFAPFGEVGRVSIPRNRNTDRPRGFGFVVMPKEAEAEVAIKSLDGTELDGRKLKVSKALPPFDAQRNKGGYLEKTS